jgi:hypothetical protein
LITLSAVGGRSAIFRSLYPEYLTARAGVAIRCAVAIPIASLPNGDYAIGVNVNSMSEVAIDGGRAFALKANEVLTLAIRRDEDPFAGMDRKPVLVPPVSWEVEPFTEAQL